MLNESIIKEYNSTKWSYSEWRGLCKSRDIDKGSLVQVTGYFDKEKHERHSVYFKNKLEFLDKIYHKIYGYKNLHGLCQKEIEDKIDCFVNNYDKFLIFL